MRTPELLELAARYGVATDYYDWRGEHVDVSADTLIAVLRALDVDATSEAGVAAALTALDERHWRRAVPPTTVAVVGNGAEVAVHVPDGAAVDVAVRLEHGDELALEQLDRWLPPREIDGTRLGEATFRIPADLPLGWHRIVARLRADEVAPRRPRCSASSPRRPAGPPAAAPRRRPSPSRRRAPRSRPPAPSSSRPPHRAASSTSPRGD